MSLAGRRKDMLICRCEEVTLAEVEQAIAAGAFDVSGVKRRTRAGMGLCQGKTCGTLVAKIIARKRKMDVASVTPGRARPPVRAMTLSALAMRRA